MIVLTGPLMAAIIAVFTPKLACVYLIVPVIALGLACVEVGAAGAARDERWLPLVRGLGLLLTACNVLYFVGNYTLAWERGDIRIARFAMGKRNPTESNYPFLPREHLVAKLRALGPEQVLATPTLERPLRVLLAHDGMRVALPYALQPNLKTVLIAYAEGERPAERCISSEGRDTCFGRPLEIDGQYLIYRQ